MPGTNVIFHAMFLRMSPLAQFHGGRGRNDKHQFAFEPLQGYSDKSRKGYIHIRGNVARGGSHATDNKRDGTAEHDGRCA